MMFKFNVLLLACVMCGASCLCMRKAKKSAHTDYDRDMAPLAVIYASQMNNPEILDFFEKLKEEIEKEVCEKSSSAMIAPVPRSNVAVKNR